MKKPRIVAVVGYKDSGKTRLVEALVRELTGRGYRVGTLKHTAEEVPLDTPGKDTWRHREAGSVASAILHGRSAAFFIDGYTSVNEAVERLGAVDFVIVEGFKTLGTVARIPVPRNADEASELTNGLEIAVADLTNRGIHAQSEAIVIPLDKVGMMADLVEEKAFPMLPGLDCHGCGYEDCRSLARAVLAGEVGAEACAAFDPGFSLRVDGVNVPLGPFVKDVTRNTVLGLVRSFKGVGDPRSVELSFEVVEGHG